MNLEAEQKAKQAEAKRKEDGIKAEQEAKERTVQAAKNKAAAERDAKTKALQAAKDKLAAAEKEVTAMNASVSGLEKENSAKAANQS